jgi:hypothetical protein
MFGIRTWRLSGRQLFRKGMRRTGDVYRELQGAALEPVLHGGRRNLSRGAKRSLGQMQFRRAVAGPLHLPHRSLRRRTVVADLSPTVFREGAAFRLSLRA